MSLENYNSINPESLLLIYLTTGDYVLGIFEDSEEMVGYQHAYNPARIEAEPSGKVVLVPYSSFSSKNSMLLNEDNIVSIEIPKQELIDGWINLFFNREKDPSEIH